jgi:hypothetical protein
MNELCPVEGILKAKASVNMAHAFYGLRHVERALSKEGLNLQYCPPK